MTAMLAAFTLDLASRVSGLSRSQVRYLDRIGVVRPSVTPAQGRGEPALYSFRDLVALKVDVRYDQATRVQPIVDSTGKTATLSDHAALIVDLLRPA